MSNNGGNEDAADNNNNNNGGGGNARTSDNNNGGGSASTSDNGGGTNTIDIIAEQIRSLQAGMEDMSRKLSSMYTLQRINDDILRKSANSINVIVRLLAGCCEVESDVLWDTLVGSDALLNNVKPSTDLYHDNNPIDHPKSHQIKCMLLDLVKMLELSEDDRDAETANSTRNDMPDDRRPSTSSLLLNTFTSDTQSTLGISSDAENSQSVSNVSIISDRLSAQNASSSRMLLDTRLTSDIEHPDVNSITTDRTSVHGHSTTANGANNDNENPPLSKTLSVPRLTGRSKCTDRSDTSIPSDGLSLHNNRPINEQQGLLKDTEAKDGIRNASVSEINSDPQLTDDKRDDHTVGSIYSCMTPIHLAIASSSVNVRPVESKEASALRRKYNNKYRYMENYGHTSGIKLLPQNDIDNVTSNVEKTKTVEGVVRHLEPIVTVYKRDKHDANDVKQKTCVESIQSKIKDKTSDNHQVVKQNKTAIGKKECNGSAVRCPRAKRTIIKADKNDEPTEKRKRLNKSSDVK